MGKLGTLEGFNLKDMLNKLPIPAGFVMDLRIWDNTILLTIEDHRACPDFQGDKAADRLPEFLDKIAELGLDSRKAIVSLGCRDEPLGTDSPDTFNVGIVHLGWVISVPATRQHDGSEQVTGTRRSQPSQLRVCRSVSLS